MRVCCEGIAEEDHKLYPAFGDHGADLQITAKWPRRHTVDLKPGPFLKLAAGRAGGDDVLCFKHVEMALREFKQDFLLRIVCDQRDRGA